MLELRSPATAPVKHTLAPGRADGDEVRITAIAVLVNVRGGQVRYDEFIARVVELGGPADRAHAQRATTATLELLGQRLAGQEPADLAAQLPAELKDPLTRHVGAAETFDVDEFLRRLADSEGQGCTLEQARTHARAVLSTLASFVSTGELDPR